MLKLGIIGYGKMGKIREAAMHHAGGAEIVRIHDPHAKDIPDKVNTQSPRDILDDPEIDGVFVCTQNRYNKQFTIEALQAGKHVFCEKPPAFNAADVEEIIAVERETNRVLMYGFNHRHHGGSNKIHELAESGEFGRVLWMRGRYGKSADEDFFDSWRADASASGGGILLDQGIHMLDLFLHVGGDFDEVHAFVSNLYWNLPDIEDNVFAIFRNSHTGQCASLHSTMTQWRHLFSFEVFMERGYMVLNGLKTPSETYGSEQLTIARNRSIAPAATWEEEETLLYEADESWDREAEIFRDTINSGSWPRSAGDSQGALRLMRLVDRIYENERHQAGQLYSRLQGKA